MRMSYERVEGQGELWGHKEAFKIKIMMKRIISKTWDTSLIGENYLRQLYVPRELTHTIYPFVYRLGFLEMLEMAVKFVKQFLLLLPLVSRWQLDSSGMHSKGQLW